MAQKKKETAAQRQEREDAAVQAERANLARRVGAPGVAGEELTEEGRKAKQKEAKK